MSNANSLLNKATQFEKLARKLEKSAQAKVSDPKVKQMQQMLSQMGFRGADGKPLAVDGVMGPNVQFALNAFMNHTAATQTQGKVQAPVPTNPAQPAPAQTAQPAPAAAAKTPKV
jgi:glutamate synthase domain-containing protein 1